MDAYEVLGVKRTDSRDTVRRVYLEKVKACHPDLFSDPERQQSAQELLTKLNVAYEEIMSMLPVTVSPTNTVVPTEQAMQSAQKMLDMGHPETALRHMARADEKTAAWYCLQGKILMAMKQYATAHQAFRVAVSMCPEDNAVRALALEAAVAVKKHQRLTWRVADWADSVIHTRHNHKIKR